MMYRVLFSEYRDSGEMSYVHVANINLDVSVEDGALEEVFRRTNNIEGSWSREARFEFNGEIVENSDYFEGTDVIAPLPVNNGITYGLRSMMLNDLVIAPNNEVYRCLFAGWERVDDDALIKAAINAVAA